MKSTFTNSSRRHFLERIAIASTVLVASPTILLANNSSKMLRFAVLGEDFSLAKIIEKSDEISLVDDHILADIIYVSQSYQKSKKNIQEVLASGKHLIVEDNGNCDLLIENCRESGLLLTIVQRSKEAAKLFENATYYECNNSKTIDFQKVITTLAFLVRNTKPIKFKIKTVEKPVEIPVS
jgi:hypothetical protein